MKKIFGKKKQEDERKKEVPALEPDIELDEEELESVSGGIAPIMGGKPKPKP